MLSNYYTFCELNNIFSGFSRIQIFRKYLLSSINSESFDSLFSETKEKQNLVSKYVYHSMNTFLRIIEQICEILPISKKVVGVTLKCYLNEKNLIHGLVIATVLKLSPHNFKTYFKFVHHVTMIFSLHKIILTVQKVSVLAWEAP